MGGGVLDDQALVALDALEHRGLLDGPLADVRPLLFGGLVVLLGVRLFPSLVPVVGELLEERGLQLGGLLRLTSVELHRHARRHVP
jgi:hypothetical protein